MSSEIAPARHGCLFRLLKLWRYPQMEKKRDHRIASTASFVVGRDRFAKISAVEGIRLSEPMLDRIRQADRNGLSDRERREAIIRAHRKA